MVSKTALPAWGSQLCKHRGQALQPTPPEAVLRQAASPQLAPPGYGRPGRGRRGSTQRQLSGLLAPMFFLSTKTASPCSAQQAAAF